jgi:hypothetical protein
MNFGEIHHESTYELIINFFFKRAIVTNMAAVRNFVIVSDKLIVYRIHAHVTNF